MEFGQLFLCVQLDMGLLKGGLCCVQELRGSERSIVAWESLRVVYQEGTTQIADHNAGKGLRTIGIEG